MADVSSSFLYGVATQLRGVAQTVGERGGRLHDARVRIGDQINRAKYAWSGPRSNDVLGEGLDYLLSSSWISMSIGDIRSELDTLAIRAENLAGRLKAAEGSLSTSQTERSNFERKLSGAKECTPADGKSLDRLKSAHLLAEAQVENLADEWASECSGFAARMQGLLSAVSNGRCHSLDRGRLHLTSRSITINSVAVSSWISSVAAHKLKSIAGDGDKIREWWASQTPEMRSELMKQRPALFKDYVMEFASPEDRWEFTELHAYTFSSDSIEAALEISVPLKYVTLNLGGGYGVKFHRRTDGSVEINVVKYIGGDIELADKGDFGEVSVSLGAKYEELEYFEFASEAEALVWIEQLSQAAEADKNNGVVGVVSAVNDFVASVPWYMRLAVNPTFFGIQQAGQLLWNQAVHGEFSFDPQSETGRLLERLRQSDHNAGKRVSLEIGADIEGKLKDEFGALGGRLSESATFYHDSRSNTSGVMVEVSISGTGKEGAGSGTGTATTIVHFYKDNNTGQSYIEIVSSGSTALALTAAFEAGGPKMKGTETTVKASTTVSAGASHTVAITIENTGQNRDDLTDLITALSSGSVPPGVSERLYDHAEITKVSTLNASTTFQGEVSTEGKKGGEAGGKGSVSSGHTQTARVEVKKPHDEFITISDYVPPNARNTQDVPVGGFDSR